MTDYITECIRTANAARAGGFRIRAAVFYNDAALAMRDAGNPAWKYYYDLARQMGACRF